MTDIIRRLGIAASIGFLSVSLSGCLLLAGAGAGYTVADEVKEGDGEFDPLERLRGEENESN